MLRSMTGYGRSEKTIGEKHFTVEIRSLNGKQIDLLLKIPSPLKPFEFDIRNLINEQLLRGSIECTIVIKLNGTAKPSSINMELVTAYYNQLKSLADQLQAGNDQLLSSILRLPDVVATSTDVLSQEEWNAVKKILQEAIDMLNKHRMDEGEALEQELLLRISNIEIYYIEKIDLTEEQVRLSNHCQYFRTLLAEKEINKGRKLSFLLQEIGREINTTGSKAYDAEIQKFVVEMKDELEKAKEQVLNVL